MATAPDIARAASRPRPGSLPARTLLPPRRKYASAGSASLAGCFPHPRSQVISLKRHLPMSVNGNRVVTAEQINPMESGIDFAQRQKDNGSVTHNQVAVRIEFYGFLHADFR